MMDCAISLHATCGAEASACVAADEADHGGIEGAEAEGPLDGIWLPGAHCPVPGEYGPGQPDQQAHCVCLGSGVCHGGQHPRAQLQPCRHLCAAFPLPRSLAAL